MRKLKSYHAAWLLVHPHRDEEWLREKLKEGFDIHHVDGDHSNDEPSNLILMEAVDHMRLHGPRLADGLVGWRKRLAEKSIAKRQAACTVEQAAPVGHYAVEFDDMSVAAYLSRVGRC